MGPRVPFAPSLLTLSLHITLHIYFISFRLFILLYVTCVMVNKVVKKKKVYIWCLSPLFVCYFWSNWDGQRKRVYNCNLFWRTFSGMSCISCSCTKHALREDWRCCFRFIIPLLFSLIWCQVKKYFWLFVSTKRYRKSRELTVKRQAKGWWRKKWQFL